MDQSDIPRSKVILNKELFFEISEDLLCIAGYDGYFKLTNPAVSKLLGYSSEELLARPVNEFIYFEDREVTSIHREGLTKSIPLLNYENRYVAKNGEIVWLSWTSVPLDEEQLVFAIAKNITHKKILERDRNALLSNLTKINQDLKQLTYTTSHDLRSPVNNLLSVFSLLDTSKIEDEETLEFISMLKSATESLKDSLNQYVDILVKKDLLTVNRTEVSLAETLLVVRQSLRSLIENANATIHVDFTEFENVQFSKAYMESIFLNLITNAIKYVKPRNFPVIHIYTRKVDGLKQLVFSDEGMGFNMEEVKDRIFGLNQTFHNHIDGKGIGLYLVHSQITSLGGSIALESKPNEGAKFILSFRG